MKKCLTGLNYNSQNNGEVDPDIFLINSVNGTFVVISLTNHITIFLYRIPFAKVPRQEL